MRKLLLVPLLAILGLWALAGPAMAQTYPVASTPSGTETVLCWQNGAWKACSLDLIKAFSGGGGGGGSGSPTGGSGAVAINNSGLFGASDNVKETGEGTDLTTYGPNVNATNPDVLNTPFETVGSSLTVTTDSSRTNPNFGDNLAQTVTLNPADGDGTFASGNGVQITEHKPTFGNLYALNSTAEGQNLGGLFVTHCEGQGDCAALDMQVTFGSANLPGDECHCLWPVAHLGQDNFVPGTGSAGLTSITPYPCSAIMTGAVTGSPALQTVTTTGTCAGPWAVSDVAPVTVNLNEEGVYISATASGSVTGIFRNNYPAAAFTAAQSGATVTVSAISAGNVIVMGQSVEGPGVPAGEVFVGYGNGTGGTGTYAVSASATVSSEAMQSHGVLSTGYLTTIPGCNGYCGQGRVWIDVSRPGYATGTAAGSNSNGTFTGVGTAWTSTAFGGTLLRPGCISLAADNYTGGNWNSAINGPSVDYYEVTSVVSTTSLGIFRNDVGGGANYHGVGTTQGAYVGYPCGRSVVVGPTSAAMGSLASNQFILDVAPGFAPGDVLIEPNSPYPDVTAAEFLCASYSAGGTYRTCGLDVVNGNRVTYGDAFQIDGSEFTPTSAFPYAFTTGVVCLTHIQTCIASSNNGAFAASQDAGQTGFDLNLQNVTGTGAQGGISLFGFMGPDLTLGDTRAVTTAHNCLQDDTSGIVTTTGAECASLPSLTSGQLPVGQASGGPLAKTVSGDATLAAGGALTVTTIGGALPGFLGKEIDNVDLHTATGDVAHFVFPSSINEFLINGIRTWGCSATTGSVTLTANGGPGVTGGQVLTGTTTAFGGSATTGTLTGGVASNTIAGHDLYLNISSDNATALTCNITASIVILK